MLGEEGVSPHRSGLGYASIRQLGRLAQLIGVDEGAAASWLLDTVLPHVRIEGGVVSWSAGSVRRVTDEGMAVWRIEVAPAE